MTTTWLGTTQAACRSETQILFRARMTTQHGEPTHAQVIAVNARSRKPLGYLDWTSTKITSSFGRTCEVRH